MMVIQLRYKIEIQVFYGGSSCNFVFWNKECELLLGLSAAQLRHTMIKAEIDDPLELPLALDQLLNLEMAFKVKWQPRWNNFSVVSILRGEPFIRQLKAPWDIDEVKKSVDEAKTSAPEDCVKEMDLKITSKHNPDPMTPIGKRDFPGGSSESATLEEFCDGQLSSNKLKKTIKLEKND
ncbi:hypothetical protein RYX36_007516 [Vicia faba]